MAWMSPRGGGTITVSGTGDTGLSKLAGVWPVFWVLGFLGPYLDGSTNSYSAVGAARVGQVERVTFPKSPGPSSLIFHC